MESEKGEMMPGFNGRRLNKMFREYALLLMLNATGWVNLSKEEIRQVNTEMHMFYRICEAIKKYK